MIGLTRAQGPLPMLGLDDLARAADRLEGVRREQLGPGDRLLVATRNSVYSLERLPDGEFRVAGGFFLRTQGGPVKLAVSGCTVGGRALFVDFVAAPGLFLEFADGTRTTRILDVRLLPRSAAAA